MRAAAGYIVLCGVILTLAGCGGTGKHPAPIRESGPKPAREAKVRIAAPTGFHVVQPGDTLYGIAFENGLDYKELADWNGLADPNLILAGARLRLTPPPRTAVSATPQPPAEPQSAVVAWDWPARGTLLKNYDEANGSKGIDIAGQKGSPVRAAASGRVMYAGDGLRGYGKLIIIKHSDSLLSAYAHQERILVAEGERVALGHPVGTMGDSDAQRVKLHFEIREYGKPVDPLRYLPD